MTNEPAEQSGPDHTPDDAGRGSGDTPLSDADKEAMHEGYIPDSRLPEDLRPGEDNPLAQGPDESEGEDGSESATATAADAGGSADAPAAEPPD